mmetsp:Transcript_22517/g.63978  ORF Transcript_22517/g.63978 Transcript_22517/m.63978 type:complete len:213 (-) Transcript_22517:154-792(-)
MRSSTPRSSRGGLGWTSPEPRSRATGASSSRPRLRQPRAAASLSTGGGRRSSRRGTCARCPAGTAWGAGRWPNGWRRRWRWTRQAARAAAPASLGVSRMRPPSQPHGRALGARRRLSLCRWSRRRGSTPPSRCGPRAHTAGSCRARTPPPPADPARRPSWRQSGARRSGRAACRWACRFQTPCRTSTAQSPSARIAAPPTRRPPSRRRGRAA